MGNMTPELPKPAMWTLEEGLAFIRDLQPKAWANGYHLALAGGVLNRGESFKDLDIIVMGMSNRILPDVGRITGAPNRVGLIGDIINGMGITNFYSTDRPEYGPSLMELWKGEWKSKPIDFFIYDEPVTDLKDAMEIARTLAGVK